MRQLSEAGTRSAAFWLITAANLLLSLTSTLNAPLVTQVVEDELGGGTALAGLLVAIAAFASVAATPLAGVLMDRLGARAVIVACGVLGCVGLLLPVFALTSPSLGVSRLLFGLGSSGLSTALTIWIAGGLPASQRSRGISLYGLSVWVGLALGPIVGQNVYHAAGATTAWAVASVIELAALACVIGLPAPRRQPRRTTAPQQDPVRGGVLRAVRLPAVVALAAWGAEAFITAFLIVHLESRGLPAGGLLGASNIFAVFAAAVVLARILLGALPDRIGPIPTALGAVAMLGAGTAVLGVSGTFWLAAVGAALVGAGFAPLYPALTILATSRLDERRHGTGIGLFSGAASLGSAVGALLGGSLIAVVGSTAAFLVIAAATAATVLPLLAQLRMGRTGLRGR